jgi:hypothetical protein
MRGQVTGKRVREGEEAPQAERVRGQAGPGPGDEGSRRTGGRGSPSGPCDKADLLSVAGRVGGLKLDQVRRLKLLREEQRRV